MDGRIVLGKYEMGELLGKGKFGKVYKAKSLLTGETVAIKVLMKDAMKKQGMTEQVKKEISIMPLLKHPYIVELKEVMASKTKIYLVMEYVQGGDLYDKVLQVGKLEQNLARKLFQQLITAVDFCHSHGVCHRDLKLENIILDSNGENLKLADFGLATMIEGQDKSPSDGLLYTPCGAFAYMAPEIIRRELYDGRKADIWSCGVILFALLAGYPPFQDINPMRMMWKIRVSQYDFPLGFPEEAKSLVHKILLPKPSERITMDEILSTPWFMKDYHHPYESCPVEGQIRPFTHVSFNAFDFILSMASGLDLSGLFESKRMRVGSVFITTCSTVKIVDEVENLAKGLDYVVFRDKEMMMGILLRGKEMGRKGKMVIGVEVVDVSTEMRVVEFSRWSGDCGEYVKLMEEEVRPAVKDVVWRWQGDWFHKKSSSETISKACCWLV